MPQLQTAIVGDSLDVWGINTISTFTVKGEQKYWFADQATSVNMSGISLGRYQMEGVQVRVYNTAVGYNQTFTIAYSGEWNKEPSGTFYYNQQVIPESVMAKIRQLKPNEQDTLSEVVNYGHLTLSSFPVAAVRQFAQNKLTQQAQQQASNDRRTADEGAKQQISPDQPQNSQNNSKSATANNNYTDRARREKEEREYRERGNIQRQSDNLWNAYQQSQENIQNAFKRDPEVERRLEREREQDEQEYAEKQRRKRAEEERQWREDEEYQREQAEKQRLRDIENQKTQQQYASYTEQRNKEMQAWKANGGQAQLDKEVATWQTSIIDYLMGLEVAKQYMGFKKNQLKNEYAHPAGLVLLLQRVLTHTEMPPYLKRLYMKNIAQWYNKWHEIHTQYNFYASHPSSPNYKVGFVPGMDEFSKILPYFNAMNSNDIHHNQWAAKSVYSLTKQTLNIGDKVIEAGTYFENAASSFYTALESNDRKKVYPKHAEYLYGLSLIPSHVVYLEMLLNLKKSDVNVTTGVSYGHIKLLNILIAHDLFSGDFSMAYFRMQQAFSLLGIEDVKRIFDQPLYWSAYSSKMGVVEKENTLLKNEDTKRLIFNAAYVYKANGFFAESEFILSTLMQRYQAPLLHNKREWFHSNYNYFDLMINLMDIYAYQERWDLLFNLAQRYEKDFHKSAGSHLKYDNLYVAPTIKNYEVGLFATRATMSQGRFESYAYKALAQLKQGDKKNALKSLNSTLKEIKKAPDKLLQNAYFNRVFEPLLLELSPKDYKKYLATKAYEKAPPLSSVKQALTNQETMKNPDAWSDTNKTLLDAYNNKYYQQGDHEGALAIAIKLLPSVSDDLMMSPKDSKLLSDILYNTSYRYFLDGKYTEGLAIADKYRRLVPLDAKKAEGLVVLNALMGNIFWVRLHEFGPWLNQGEVDDNKIGSGKDKIKGYFLQDALTAFGREKIDGQPGQIILEEVIRQLAEQQNLAYQLPYLLNAADFSRSLQMK